VPSPLTVLIDPWRMHPLAWLHRVEARAIIAELRAAGQPVDVAAFVPGALPQAARILLRLSDPVMVDAVRLLTAYGIAYLGPGAAALVCCYDKWIACRTLRAAGVDCPETRFAADAAALARPLVLKPRRGSDSIGLRVMRSGAVPAPLRNQHTIAQTQLFGAELTVAVIGGIAGMPLRIDLPEGVPYTFLRKYLWRPRCAPLADHTLATRVQQAALGAARALGVDWAARIDLIHERASGRVFILECDAAPLVGPASAFAASLTAGGMTRAEQLARLLCEA